MYKPESYSIHGAWSCSSPITALDPGAPDRLRRARKEWLGFRPIDSAGNVGPLTVVARGKKDHVQVAGAELMRRVLNARARGVVLVHNHPSGKLEPSNDDLRLTDAFRRMCRMVGLRVHGHFIVTRNSQHLFGVEA